MGLVWSNGMGDEMLGSVTKDLVIGFCQANFIWNRVEITPYLLACIVLAVSRQIACELPDDNYLQTEVFAGLMEYSATLPIDAVTKVKFDSVLASLLDRQDDAYVVDTCLKMGLAGPDKALEKFVKRHIAKYTEFRTEIIANQRMEKAKQEQGDMVMNTSLSDYELNELLNKYFVGRETWITPFMVSCVLVAHSGEIRSYLETVFGKNTVSEIVATMKEALDKYTKDKKINRVAYQTMSLDETTNILVIGGKDSQKLERCLVFNKISNGDAGLGSDVMRACEDIFKKYDLTLATLFPDEDKRQSKDFSFAKQQRQSANKSGKVNKPKIGIDLVEKARELREPPVFGRDSELRLIEQALLKKNKGSVLLVGKAGVGKTALVDGLAYAIATKTAHPMLDGTPILSVNLGELMAGTTYRGDLETKLQNILTYCEKENGILFIDEIHALINGRGKEEQFSDLLKPYLTNGRVRIIGATTDEEYKTMRDKAFMRRFNILNVSEPTPEVTVKILQKLRESYERTFSIKISDECLRDVVHKSGAFIHNRHFPDKAIDLLNTVCVLATYDKTNFECTSDLVNQALSTNFDIPMEMLSTSEPARIAGLNKNLNAAVYGQEAALKQVSDALVCSYVMRTNQNKRPQSVMLFAGPSGVGKTETAKQIAKLLGRQFVCLNMNEYQSSMDVQKLGGAAPGYVGYDEGGQLTNLIAKNPYAVLLLDEFEKAHTDVQRSLLQVFDQGTYTNNFGDAVSFKNTIIILATNAGVKYQSSVGYGHADERMTVADEELNKIFLPEFLGRVNKIIKFDSLSQGALQSIVNHLVSELNNNMRQEYNLDIVVNDEIKNWLIKQGYDPRVGARLMQNKFSEMVEQPLSYYLLENYNLTRPEDKAAKQAKKQKSVVLQLQDNKIHCVSR